MIIANNKWGYINIFGRFYSLILYIVTLLIIVLEKQKINIAIFASGRGSNAQKIIDHFNKSNGKGKVVLIVTNNPNAGVIKIAENENIKSLVIERKNFYEDGYLDVLKRDSINLIVLAGFMWMVPPQIIRSFPNKIVNIHPALLPKFGGKKMYGNFVHEAVINAKEKESGITIHYVDEIYDNGKVIFQATCTVDENESAETLANKIHVLEHEHYPKIIESLL